MSSHIPNPYATPRSIEYIWGTETAAPQRYRIVGLALKAMCAGIAWLILLLLLALSGAIMMLPSPLNLILSLTLLISLGAIAVGPLLCLTVPRETRLRPFAAAAAAAMMVAVFSGVLSLIQPMANSWMYIGTAALCLSAAMFLLFLHHLAISIRRSDLARRSHGVSLLWTGMVTTFVGGVVMAAIWPPNIWMLMLFVISIVCGVSFMVGYIYLTNGLSKAIMTPRVRA